jgi:hypothetical protein
MRQARSCPTVSFIVTTSDGCCYGPSKIVPGSKQQAIKAYMGIKFQAAIALS